MVYESDIYTDFIIACSLLFFYDGCLDGQHTEQSETPRVSHTYSSVQWEEEEEDGGEGVKWADNKTIWNLWSIQGRSCGAKKKQLKS